MSATLVASKLEEPKIHFWPYFFFGILGVIVSEYSSQEAKIKLKNDYKNKQFPEIIIEQGQSAHGFLYFMPSKGTPAFNQAKLIVRLIDTEDATSFVVELPLTGLKFKAMPAK